MHQLRELADALIRKNLTRLEVPPLFSFASGIAPIHNICIVLDVRESMGGFIQARNKDARGLGMDWHFVDRNCKMRVSAGTLGLNRRRIGFRKQNPERSIAVVQKNEKFEDRWVDLAMV